MHAISIGSIAVDVHDHLVVKGLNDAVTRVWNLLFVEVPASGLVGIAPEEVNLVVNDLLKEDLELSMDLMHLAGRTDVVNVKDSNSNSVQPSTLDRCAVWICRGF